MSTGLLGAGDFNMSLLDELNSGGLQMTHCCNELNAGDWTPCRATPPMACLVQLAQPQSHSRRKSALFDLHIQKQQPIQLMRHVSTAQAEVPTIVHARHALRRRR